MQLYPKTSAELVFDLITSANPSLPFPVNSDTIYLGPVSAIPVVPPAIVNTSVRLNTKPNSPYIGNKVVQYQRISLANLFKDITPNIRKYSAAGEANNSPFSLYQLLPFINAQYGLKLSTDDVSDIAFPAYTTITENGVSKRVSSVTMTAKATSQAFIGSVIVRTQAGQRELDSMITKQELNGRVYPGGNDFTTTPKDRVSMAGYGIDFTEKMLSNPGNNANYAFWLCDGPLNNQLSDKSTWQQSVFDIINAKDGTAFTVFGAAPATRWNLKNIQAVSVVLPSALYPEANSKDYNRMIVVTLTSGYTWGFGSIYMHYNV